MQVLVLGNTISLRATKEKTNKIQWNLVNTTTVWPKKFGRINGVVVLKGVDQKRKCFFLNDVMANGVRFQLA